MMRRTLLRIALAAATLAPGAAMAQQIHRNETITLSNSQGYLLYHGDRAIQMMVIREPDSAALADYYARREAALVAAHQEYERALQAPADPARPEKPVEPTLANLDYPGIEEKRTIWIIAAHPVVKDKQSGYHYLTGLLPGTYAIYGAVFPGMQGWAGICMCMGTVKFEVVAGQIVDIGEFGFTSPMGARVPAEAMAALSRKGMTTLVLTPPQPGQTYPERLAALPIRPATLHAAGKIANFHGVQIDRLTPIPGVLGYRRDQVIDLRTGQPLP